ncbi:MAG: glycosyltransferase family 2 protein [Candidatus Cloacimonetes bacterium]|nr:glycosyltransferase family 2 protein [Candidatus Cloacimonadota bacterium]
MKSISIITATFNSMPAIESLLTSIGGQDYEQEKIEVLVADGGSTDGTIEVIRKYGGIVIPEKTGSPEAAKAIALKNAKNEICLMLASDNILPGSTWLKTMVNCLEEEPTATGAYTWRYTHRRDDKILNRYFSLFGANDPVAYFLGKADRQSYLSDKWTLAGKAIDKGKYFFVEFNRENLPTVGDNGFLIHRELLLKAKTDEKHFFHIDVNYDLVSQGFDKYVVVKNDVVHASGENFWQYFRRRKKYLENLYLRDLNRRRYHVYKKTRDRGKIVAYSFWALSFIGPTIESVRGFRRLRDPAWFLHPMVCFLIFWVYFVSVLNWHPPEADCQRRIENHEK